MKNYSSNKAQKGKTAYRTPSKFIYQNYMKTTKVKSKQKLQKMY
jgi:hypothetical protein